MKMYNDYSKSVFNKKQLITPWGHEEGVFKIKSGKYITRVRKGISKTFTTISQHTTEIEAVNAYNNFYNKNNE